MVNKYSLVHTELSSLSGRQTVKKEIEEYVFLSCGMW